MKTKESVQIKVGVFVFAALFLSMVIIFFLGSEKQLFKRQYTLKSFFEDISGLRVGAQAQLAGVNAGMVESIRFGRSLEDKKVIVTLSLGKNFQSRIREDSMATINTQGLLGDKIVTISVGSPESRMLEDGDVLSSEGRPDFLSLVNKGSEIMDNVNRAAVSLSSVLDEVKKGRGLLHTLIYETPERPVGRDFSETAREIRIASQELRIILQKINKGEGTIGAFVSDPSLYNDIRRLFGKLERNNLLKHIIRSRVRDLDLEKTAEESSDRRQSR